MTEDEVLKLALEALENVSSTALTHGKIKSAIDAIEEALAKPEYTQEPCGWAISYDGSTPSKLWIEGDGVALDLEVKRIGGTCCKIPLYTTPHAQPAPVQSVAGLYAVLFLNNWDGEGDQEYAFAKLSEDGVWTDYENGSLLFKYKGDEIISAWRLSESTPPAQPAPVQKPAAWGNLANGFLDSDRVLLTDKAEAEKYHRDTYNLTPLYTTTPAAQPEHAMEPVGHMGLPLSCGRPLCGPNNHHPLCKLATPHAAQQER